MKRSLSGLPSKPEYSGHTLKTKVIVPLALLVCETNDAVDSSHAFVLSGQNNALKSSTQKHTRKSLKCSFIRGDVCS